MLYADDADAVVPALDRARAAAQGVRPAACAGVIFLIDECVSPLLRLVATEFGYVAHFIHDLGWGQLKDGQLRPRLLGRNLTLITNNRDDWREIMADEEVHPGLIVIVENAPRPNEIDYFTRALVALAGLSDLVNTVVEVEADGTVTAYTLPE